MRRGESVAVFALALDEAMARAASVRLTSLQEWLLSTLDRPRRDGPDYTAELALRACNRGLVDESPAGLRRVASALSDMRRKGLATSARVRSRATGHILTLWRLR